MQLKWALAALLALVLGGAALDLANKGADNARRLSALQAFSGERFAIPSGTLLSEDGCFLTDSSASGDSSLWVLVRRGRSLRIQRWLVGASGVSPQRSFRMTSPPPGGLTAAGLVPWRTTGKALVLSSLQDHSVIVQIRQAAPPYTVLTQTRTPTLGLATGSVRSAFIDGAPHGVAKLIVVDRPARTAGSMRIRVLTATNNFQSIMTDVRLSGVNSFPAAAWSLVVGGVNSPSGDLLFISRTKHTATGKIEVHALLSRKKYSGYGTQMPIGPTEGSGVNWSYALAPARNGAVAILYGIDPVKRLLMRFPL